MEVIAYKVLTAIEFSALQAGAFEGAPVDLADGYIHLSTASQLSETVARHFAGHTGLVIAAVDLKRLGEKIRWEVSRDGALFPHLYGRLHASCVIAFCALEQNRDGSVRLPA